MEHGSAEHYGMWSNQFYSLLYAYYNNKTCCLGCDFFFESLFVFSFSSEYPEPKQTKKKMKYIHANYKRRREGKERERKKRLVTAA